MHNLLPHSDQSHVDLRHREHARPLRDVGMSTTTIRAVLVLTLLIGAACGSATTEPTIPATAPYMSGRITSVVQSSAFAGTIRVESIPSNANAGLKALARVDAVTVVLSVDGKAGEFRSLAVGQWVRLWFDGAIAESFPVQGTAGTVKIDSLGVTPLASLSTRAGTP